jgi:hypothetical protein
MNSARILVLAALVLLREADCFGQTIVWNGNGDATSWSSPQNWVGGQVPGSTNNVVITNGAGANVVISTAVSVESILCNKALTISDSLAVTAGASSLQGPLAVAVGATLSASGSNTTFTSSGSVDITNANLYVSGGATMSLPGAVNCNDSAVQAGTVWQATGTNSVLALAGLTNIAVPSDYPEVLEIQALAGGVVNLDGLISISGVVEALASGAGSELNLSALQSFAGASDYNSAQLQPGAGGTILTGTLGSLTDVSVVLGSGTLNLNAVTNLSYSTLSVTNGAVTLANVANVANANLSVSGGASLSLPGVVNCNYSQDQAVMVWQASGSGSTLAMTGLTNLAVPGDYSELLQIEALAGGNVKLSGLISISGVVEAETGGSGSELNLSALQSFAGSSDYNSAQLQPSAGGTILTGTLGSLTDVSVVLGSGTLNLSTVTNLRYSTLSVTNGAVTFGNVANVENANLYVSGGATLSLPAVVNCAFNASQAVTVWQASGSGSVLALTALTNLVVPSDYPEVLQIQALAGGVVNLGAVISFSGVVEVDSGGSGSEVNLSSLQSFGGFSDYSTPQLQPSDGGTILAGSLQNLTGVAVGLGSGTLNLEAVTNLSYSTLTVTNGAVTLSNVVDVANASLYVSGGATLSLPGVVNCNYNAVQAGTVWQASGSGSVLALTGLTNLVVPSDYPELLQIQALAGGVVNLSGLISISGVVEAESSGSGSELNLSALQGFAGAADYYSAELQPGDGGAILAGQLGSVTGVSVVLGGGTLNLSTVTNLSYSTLSVTNGTVTLGSVANVANASLYVSGGATLSLPAVVNCDFNAVQAGTVWQSSGSGSVLALTGLTNLVVPSDYPELLQIQALAGGLINLGALTSISGVVEVESSGSGSEVNLSALQGFGGSSDDYSSELQPSGGGTILTGQLKSLTGVAVSLGGGTLNLSMVTNLDYTVLSLTNGVVTLSNVVNVDNTELYVSGGASLSLPGVLNCTYANDSTPFYWQAAGTNSVLALPGLTNLVVSSYGIEVLTIQALAGGEVNLSGLISISGVVEAASSGGGSELNLSALQTFAGSSDDYVAQLQPSGGATILTGPLGSLTGVNVVLGGGTLNLSAVTNLSYSTLSLTNGTLRLGNVTDIDDANLYVSSGATLSLPAVVNSVYANDSTPFYWQASGSGSVLAMTGLTNLVVPSYGIEVLIIQALAGGEVNLSGLISISGVVEAESSGSGSELNLSALQVFAATSDDYPSQLQPSDGGTILAGPLGSLMGLNIVLGGTGTLNLNAVTNLSYTTLSVTNGMVTLNNVVDVANANLYVSGGATLSLPGVVNCTYADDSTPFDWQASGLGSVLALPGLTNLVVPSYGIEVLMIQALANAEVNLGGLISISGVVEAESSGSGSELNLSALQNFAGNSDDYISQLQPLGGGSILTGPLGSLTGVSVVLGGGALDLNTVTNLNFTTLTVTNGVVTLTNVANVSDANLYVGGGATLSLPGVVNCAYGNDSTQLFWQSSGSGSVLALAGLTNLTVPSYGIEVLTIQALAGGVVNLHGLTSISGVAQVQASGGGEANLSALQNFAGNTDGNPAQLLPGMGGTILTGPLGSLTGVSVVLGSGTLELNTVTNLSFSTLTVTNGAVTLSNVVNVANANLYVSDGASLSLPGVVNCAFAEDSTAFTWQASGTNSLLSLAGLTNVTLPNFGIEALAIQALAGGDVELSSLYSIANGEVQVLSSGGGSVVDVTRLIDYQTATTTLTATDGGVIVLAKPKLTITANNASMTYGGTVPPLSVSYSGFTNTDTSNSLTSLPTISTTGTSLSHAGTYPITGSGAVDTNYTIVYVQGTLTINPAPLTITASNASKTYGQTETFSSTAFSSVGLLNGDTIASVTLTSAGAAPTAPIGSYPIMATNASGPRAGNYSITYDNGTLTVTPAQLTITADNATKYFGKTLTFSGTAFVASGLQNSQTVGSVTLTSAGAAASATVAGSPYPIMPSAATGGTFTPTNYTIGYANGSLTVLPVASPPTISTVLPAAGPTNGGTLVTISGTGFESGAAVLFGSLPAASVTFENSNVLTAVTPASASGTMGVSVNNPDGNSYTDASAFTFGVGPDIALQPTNLALTPGQTAQFQVEATGSATLTYQWQYNGANLSDSSGITGVTTPTLTITDVGTGNDGYYRCVVTNLYASVTSTAAVLSVITSPSSVTVSPASVQVGLDGSATLTATASGAPPFNYYWYEDGSFLVGQTTSVLNIPSAQSNATYTVVVSNAAGSVTSAPVPLTLLAYCVKGQPTQATYPEGTNFIPINVVTYNCGSSNPVPSSAAVVWLTIDGTSRNLTVFTDGSGNGTAYFTPLPVEVGLVKYGFGLPGEAQPAPVGSFTIIGMNLSAQSESPQLVVNAPQTNTLLLNNLTAVPLTGITATVVGAPSQINVQVSVPSVLPSNGAVQTTYILEATATTQAPVEFSIQYTSAQGATVTLPITATISPPRAQFATTPPNLVGAMINGTQTLVTFALTNFGGAPSGPIQVNLPPAPWLSLATAQPIPSLATNQGGQIMLSLMPTNGQALGEYTGDLVIQGSNSSITVPFVFTDVSSLKGNLVVTAQDELTVYGASHPNLSNATVTVTDFLTGTNVGTQVTGSNGIVTFSNLTSAYYTVTAESPDHGSFSTTLLVAANTNTPVTAFLSMNLVDYTWTVTPTTIPDTYFFTLTTIFVTEVPWPEVSVEPIDLCTLPNCTNQYDLIITNGGLIAAEGLQIVINNSNTNWSFTALVTNLGNLAAESSITVPIVLTRLGCATNAGGPTSIEASLNWYVAALNGTEYNSTPIFIYNANCVAGNGGFPPVGYVQGGAVGVPVVTQPINYSYTPTNGAIVNVTLQIDQTAVLTANAFHATLNLANNSGAEVTDVQVTINPLDSSGNPDTNAFFIQTPLLSGINAVDGTGTLGIGASAQANWTIVPTTNAAPMGTSNYAIGGSISYVLDGEPVTIPLFAVPITVLPEPQLYLDYFLQHDVYSQDPFSSVIEPPIPFALGLRVRNLGYGVADDFTITSAQPVIINNANGLLINFQIIASDVGTNATPVPSLTLDLGNIDPGTNVEGIWWMTASLEGEFTNFQATFQHIDSLGGTETSLVNSVKIHDMNHVVEITCPSNDGLPDFLCNDTTNVNALPDDVYSSDGNVYPVTSLTGATSTGVVSGYGSTITVNDVQDIIPSGFVYFQLPDPSLGQYAITSVKRSDGEELLVGTNVWQTPLRPHLVPPQLTNLIHIFDCNSTGSYTVTYGPPITPPSVTTLATLNVTPTNATLVGIVNPQSGSTEYYFEWGLTTSYGNYTPTNWLTMNLGSPQQVTAYLNNLTPQTVIHYQVVAINSAGTNYGGDQTVGTPALPLPVITPVANQLVIVGTNIVITNTAMVSTPPVTFTLGGTVPEGASITTNGVFTWSPTCAQGSTSNVITIWATDSGTPPLSNSITFVITVAECVQLEVGSAVLQVGQSTNIPVTLFSTVGITNLSFDLSVPAGRFTNFTITPSNSTIASATVQATGSSPPLFTLITQPGQTLPSPSLLGTIGFTALAGDSGFIPVAATNILGFKSDGAGVGNVTSLPGQITVVGFHPLLGSSLGGNSMIRLTLYGTPGSNYQVAYSTNLALTNWQAGESILLTNVQQSVNLPATNAHMYFRLQ